MEISSDIIKKTEALKYICVDSQNRSIGVLKPFKILEHIFLSFSLYRNSIRALNVFQPSFKGTAPVSMRRIKASCFPI